MMHETSTQASILIVDDTPANISLLRNILTPQGYQIFVATSGEMAIKVAMQAKPALVLLDVMMPGMGGIATCRAFKAEPLLASIPIIFVTAKNDVQDIVEGFQAGAVDYINKPVRIEEVSARVKTHLQIRQYANEQHEQAEWMRAIVNNMAEGLLIFDNTGKICLANPASHHMLGYSEQQLQGRSLYDLLDIQTCNTYLACFAHPQRTHHPCYGTREVQMRNKAGKNIALDMTMTPMFLQQPLFIALLHDISMHKESESALLQLAHMDRLTNIANRRHFDQVLQREWQRAKRNHLPLSLLVADVDFFKHYNDNLGHQAGDACLQSVAQALSTLARRPTDIVARYGGEEFVLLFAETNLQGAQEMAQLALQAVAKLALPHPASSVGPHVSISIGYACLQPLQDQTAPMQEADHLFALADRALYAAKQAGRNCAVMAETQEVHEKPSSAMPTLPPQ